MHLAQVEAVAEAPTFHVVQHDELLGHLHGGSHGVIE